MHARNYRHVKNRAYTRKDYARGFPPPKIVKFTMGDTKAQFELEGKLLATERVQIRHSALEAARVATNRVLMDKLINDYYMTVHLYPHIILRENKMIFGAHADRLQQGMRRSFGTAVGTAAKVEVDQPIITVRVKASALETAKEALKRGSAKLPIHCRIVFTKIQQVPSKTEQAQPTSETTEQTL
ncbi:MAG: 50S ribosomal protein L16 [Nitrososphaerota archaeon]|jgi:large subunit ribosomal protein L10e|nr:50S ribosomal protein L16 [Nitrososphaerota archaeon]